MSDLLTSPIYKILHCYCPHCGLDAHLCGDDMTKVECSGADIEMQCDNCGQLYLATSEEL